MNGLKKTALYGAVLGMLTIGLGGLHLYTPVFLLTPKAKYTRLENRMDAAIERNNWYQALVLCNKILERVSADVAIGRVDEDSAWSLWEKTVIHTKYALVMTGELLENYFSYSHYHGFDSLIPSQEFHISQLRSTHRFFSGIELQALALASAFNRFETSEDPSALNDFIQSSLIAGDYFSLKTFINRLEKDGNRKLRRQARKYRKLLADTNKINNDPYYIARRELGPTNDFFVNWDFDLSITKFHFSNPKNQKAFEYTMMFALLHNIDDYFPEILTLLETFNYSHIPRHLEEAILMVSGYGWNPEISQNLISAQTFGGLTIRPQTIARHENLVYHFNMLQQGQITFDWFADMYRDTYQFHYFNTIFSQQQF